VALIALSGIPASAFAVSSAALSPVTDLRTQILFAKGVTLTWSAPSDSGNPAASYDLRYATSPIDSDNAFANAVHVNSPTPKSPGSTETVDLTGLADGTHYYFALRWTSSDGYGSPISNVAQATTLQHDEFIMSNTPMQRPMYMPNDYTTAAFQFTTDSFYCGLDPNSSYYYRIVFSRGITPNATTDRGWIAKDYQQTYTSWASLSDPWNSCPTIGTDGNGKPNSGNKGVWSTIRLGDTRESGLRYANVTMIKFDPSTGAIIPGTEKHTVNPAPITVFDPATAGAWLHNGATNGSGPSRICVSDLVPWPNERTYALSQGYPRWSQPDDPEWETSDKWSGSLRFAVPLGLGPLDIRAGNEGQTSWAPMGGSPITGFQVTQAGASYAFGTATGDVTPPSAPTTITASSRGYPKDIALKWSGATDNAGVTSYYVYRWQDIDPGLPYTAFKTRLGKVTGQFYVDSNVTLGQTYHYEVRSIDAATNISRGIRIDAVSQNSVGPAQIDDLQVTSTTGSGASLAWTAVSSTSAEGTVAVTAYDLRYAAAPIVSESDFANATPVATGLTPAAPGTTEHYTIADKLHNGQTYYFAVRAVDAVAVKSPISNSPSAAMPLGQPFTLSPGALTYPTNWPNDHTAVAIRIAGAGSTATGLVPNARYIARAVFSQGPAEDRSTDRGWTAYGAGYPDNGWRQLSEGWETLAPSAVAARCLLSTDGSGQLTGTGSTVIARVGDTRITGLYRMGLELIQIDAGGKPMAGTTRVISGGPTVSVFDANTQGSRIHNGWSPADGTASDLSIAAPGAPAGPLAMGSGYPLYFNEEPPAPWAGAAASGAFTMALPTSVLSFDVYRSGAIWSPGGTPLSYTALVRTPGASYAIGSSTEPVPVPPAAVTAAAASAAGLAGALRLTWTPIGADAAGYRIYRWQDAPAGALYTMPKVAIATVTGATSEYVDRGLSEGAAYQYEIRSFDAAGNMAPPLAVSGVAIDMVPPASITDVSVESTSSGSVGLRWTAPADVTAVTSSARATSYDIRYSMAAITSAGDFAAATPVSGEPTPSVPGTVEHLTVNHLFNGATYYFAIRSTDANGNVSGLSNAASSLLPALPAYTLQFRSAPDYVANDYTPSFFQIGTPATGSGLLPNSTYYYKVIFSQAPQHENATDRGWTANGNQTPRVTWAQADEPWGGFPTLTTDPDGAIIEAGSNGLGVYGRVGDTRVTGDRYVQVLLARKSADSTAVVPGSEVYPTTPLRLHVFNPETQGAWVHNGIPNTLGTSRIALAPALNSSECFALCEGYPRWLYGDGDDPYFGGVDPTGSFRMAVPVTSGSFGVYTGNGNSHLWNGQEGWVVTLPGSSYAVGASNLVPPSAPTTITASSSGLVQTIRVSWSGAADDGGVAGYYVYRWQDVPAGARYTPEKMRIATVTDGEEYRDSAVTLGQTYHYEVRAFDDATNVGPGIETTAISRDSVSPRPILNLAASLVSTSSVRLTWTAPSRGASETVLGYELRRSSTPILTVSNFETATPVPCGLPGSPGATESMVATNIPTGTNYFSIRSYDRYGNRSALSNTVSIAMSVATTITIKVAPTSVKLPKPFVLQGILTGGRNGDWCVAYVKKPGTARWSYSSNRIAYGGTATGANWWYRYTPKLRGTYSFYGYFQGDATRKTCRSGMVSVKVK
jgi:hypothetical protein